MKVNRILVTGDSFFARRNQFLFQTLESYFQDVAILEGKTSYVETLKIFMKPVVRKLSLLGEIKADSFYKSAKKFIEKSCSIEQQISKLNYTPDLIFHIHSMSSPLWNTFDIPYVFYLDYTMALARENWSPWAPFESQNSFVQWIECEQKAYSKAHHIFTKSNVVKSSLIESYNINPDKITVIYASGQFLKPYQGEKKFELKDKRILFNGSDFERKGGDLLLAAFRQVRTAVPDTTLTIIGSEKTFREDGVINLGFISSLSVLHNLFLKTDLVVSPAYCEPLGFFFLDAMNYGIPCIVSDRDGMPEIIEHEVNGIVVSQPNPAVLANQIINLLSNQNLLEEMSNNARLKIASQLNWNDIAKRIVEVLVEI